MLTAPHLAHQISQPRWRGDAIQQPCQRRPRSRYRMRGEFVGLGGARLYCYAAGTRGAGEPIVFIHGFPTSSHLWEEVVPLVPEGHRIVVLDLLGYGRSDRPLGRELSIKAHADRVIQLLDILGINYACVIGHDLGGGIAQSMAIRYPTRVSRSQEHTSELQP